MKRHILLLSCLLLGSVTGGLRGAVAGDAPANPSFEALDSQTALPAHWTPWNAETHAAYTLARACDGVASLLLTDDSPAMGHGVRSELVPVTPGKTYLGSGSLYIEALHSGAFSIYLEFWNKSGIRLSNFSTAADKQGQWVKLNVRASAPEGATSATLLCYGSSATVGTACFDAMSITAAPSAAAK
ncbi:MAG TPA: hypothetical protein VHR86_01375 [Armatimonadota bacterium]|nr:hypothetical protein [Armatimonadota bacterium]